MKYVTAILASCMLVACGMSGQKGSLDWRSDTLVRVQDDSTLSLFIVYPVLTDTGAVAEQINQAIVEVIRSSFDGLDSLQGDETLDQCIDSLVEQKNSDEYLRGIPYEFTSEGTVFCHENVVTVWIERYIYTGGAHGMTFSEYFNFDRSDGHRLTNDQLVRDTAELRDLNRKFFNNYLEDNGIDIQKEDLFVSLDELPLPENMGFDSLGLVMIYNQYEIAPYARGRFVYELPYDQVQSILSDEVKGR